MLKLIDIKSEKDNCSNIVTMTFVFKPKSFPKDIFYLDCVAKQKIKEMLCFDFCEIGKCYWSDDKCKTIKKRVSFQISEKVSYFLDYSSIKP